MILQKIKTQTTWAEAANTLNENSQSIQNEFKKVRTHIRGYFLTAEELKSSIPVGFVGDIAYIGNQAPFAIFQWVRGNWADSGEVGGNEEVILGNYVPIQGDSVIQGDIDVGGGLWVDDNISLGGDINSENGNVNIPNGKLDAGNIETGEIRVQGSATIGSLNVEGSANFKTIYVGEKNADVIMADGTLKPISEFIFTSDYGETEYDDVFQNIS